MGKKISYDRVFQLARTEIEAKVGVFLDTYRVELLRILFLTGGLKNVRINVITECSQFFYIIFLSTVYKKVF